jgi:hypothetical protein
LEGFRRIAGANPAERVDRRGGDVPTIRCRPLGQAGNCGGFAALPEETSDPHPPRLGRVPAGLEQFAHASQARNRTFSRLLGRAYTEPAKSIRQLIGQMYAPAMERFKAAFGRALPELPKDELVWRLHFMFGTLAYTLAATDTVQLIAGAKPEDRYDARVLEDRLTAFMSAGLLAPLPGAQPVRIAA